VLLSHSLDQIAIRVRRGDSELRVDTLNRQALDFTEGPIAKKMLLFAGPIFFSNILQTSYQFVDSLWVGNLLGADALAALSISTPITFAVLSFMIGINGTTLTILSQHRGQGDHEGIRKSLNAFVVILGSLSLLLGFAGYASAEFLLRLIGTPEELMEMAKIYLEINFIGIVFLLGYNFIGTVLRALGDSKTPIYFILAAVVLNIILDPLLIAGFGWGMAGAAYATVIAQGAAFIYGVVFCIIKGRVPFTKPTIPEKKYAKAVFRLGLPGGFQMVAISSGMVVIMSIVNSFGATVVAGFGAAQRIESIIIMPAQTLGSAVNSMAGQNIGANKWRRVTQISYTGLAIIATLSLAISTLVFLNAEMLISMFVSDDPTIAFGTTYLRFTAFFYLFLGANFVLNGIMRSSGAMFQVLILNIISFWVLRFPLVYLFSYYFGEIGIAYGYGASLGVSSLVATLYYFFGKWRDVKIYDE